MNKKLFLILAFGTSVFLLLPNFAEAACGIGCCGFCSAEENRNCCAARDCSNETVGIIGNASPPLWTAEEHNICVGTSCIDSCQCSITSRKCKNGAFPMGNNSQSCTARDGCWSFFAGCNDFSRTGVWDAYESQCVTCTGYDGNFENRILGNTTAVIAHCGNLEGNLGDGKCESACGADPLCDERSVEAPCGADGVCSPECQCIFPVEEPDLIITDISTSGNTISYIIENQGNGDAGDSYSYLYIDGSYIVGEDDYVVPLLAGAFREESFAYNWTCSLDQDLIQIFADGGNAVSESIEANNGRSLLVDCPTYTLSVFKAGTGLGTVTDTGINCGADCSESYPAGTSVTLTATPAAGSTFAGWSGACSGTGGCILTMNSNKSVTATFNLEAEFDFSISINPTLGSAVPGQSVSPSPTVTVTLIFGTTQSVSFFVLSGLPSGALASFSPTSCYPTPTCSSAMTISTSATTPPGSYAISICGTSGGKTHCVVYGLLVEEISSCIPPDSGPWEIDRHCILDTTNGNLIIKEGDVRVKEYPGTHTLTLNGDIIIENTGTLDMKGDSNVNFSGSPRYIYIESGGKLYQANTAGFNKEVLFEGVVPPIEDGGTVPPPPS